MKLLPFILLSLVLCGCVSKSPTIKPVSVQAVLIPSNAPVAHLVKHPSNPTPLVKGFFFSWMPNSSEPNLVTVIDTSTNMMQWEECYRGGATNFYYTNDFCPLRLFRFWTDVDGGAVYLN